MGVGQSGPWEEVDEIRGAGFEDTGMRGRNVTKRLQFFKWDIEGMDMMGR